MEARMQRADPTAPTTPEQYRAAIERQERVIADLRKRLESSEPAPKGKNEYGLDARYFHEQLSCIVRDVKRYTPGGMMRALAKLALVANPSTEDQENR